MALTQATWDSVNVIFAQLGLDVGPENIAKTAYRWGSPRRSGTRVRATSPASSARTATSPRPRDRRAQRRRHPLEQANAYATLANDRSSRRDRDRQGVFPGGKVDEPSANEGKRVLTPGEAYEVTKVLKGVITSGTGAGYTSIGCQSEAGKTGPAKGLSDAWFVGYTPMYSTAVWTGHPLSRDSTGFGGPTSGPIWRSYMEAAQGGDCPDFEVPSSLPTLTAYHGEHTASSSSSCSSSSSSSCDSSSSYTPELRAAATAATQRPRGRLRAGGGTETGAVTKPKPHPRAGPAGATAASGGDPTPRAWPGRCSSEFDLIAAINERLPAPGPRVRVPSGDDAAVVEPRAASAITVDAIVDGVHFVLDSFGPQAVGRKALAAGAVRPRRDGGCPGRGVRRGGCPGGALTTRTCSGSPRARRDGVPGGGRDRRGRPGQLPGAGRLGDRDRLRAGAVALRHPGRGRPRDLVAVTGELGGAAAALR